MSEIERLIFIRLLLQVCGNSHSVSQLTEWLKSWHDKGRKSDKKCKVEEQCVVENNEDRLYNTESDMEDQEDDPCLESVLLVTGPVGVCTCPD